MHDDGMEDFFHFGQNSNKEINSQLYINNGASGFQTVKGSKFEGIISGCGIIHDFDGDNKLDIIYSGHNGISQIFIVYKNKGDNLFEEYLRNSEK